MFQYPSGNLYANVMSAEEGDLLMLFGLMQRVQKGGDCGIARNTEEGEDDGGEEASETVIDIIDGFKVISCFCSSSH